MPTTTERVEVPHGRLFTETIELTSPWIDAPETILFCHGVGTNADIWQGWLPSLIDRYRIVRFDTRGFGRSGAPDAGFRWTLDALADDIMAVARATDTQRFHLVAESMGGTVALVLAARGEPALRSVSVASTSHKGHAIGHVREWRAEIEREGMAAWSTRMSQRRFAPGAVTDAAYAWFDRTQAATDAESLLSAAEMLIGADLSDQLPGIAVPCLILAPDSSPFVPVSLGVEQKSLIPDAELRTFPGVRHGLSYSHGAACAAALLEFLERRVSPSERGARPA